MMAVIRLCAVALALVASLGGCAGHRQSALPLAVTPAASAVGTSQGDTVSNTLSCAACPACPACPAAASSGAALATRERIIERLADPRSNCGGTTAGAGAPSYPPYPVCACGPADAASGAASDAGALARVTQAATQACDARMEAADKTCDARVAGAARAWEMAPIELRLGQGVAYLGSPLWLLIILFLLLAAAFAGCFFGWKQLLAIWRESKELDEWKGKLGRAIAVVIGLGVWVPLLTGAVALVALAVVLHGMRDAPIPPAAKPGVVIKLTGSTPPPIQANDESWATLAAVRAESQDLRIRLAAAEATVAALREAGQVRGPGQAREGDGFAWFVGLGGLVVGVLAGLLACPLRREGGAAGVPFAPITAVNTGAEPSEGLRPRRFGPEDAALLARRAGLWLAELRAPGRRLLCEVKNPPGGGLRRAAPASNAKPPNQESINLWLGRCRTSAVELNDRLLEIIDFCDGAQRPSPRWRAAKLVL